MASTTDQLSWVGEGWEVGYNHVNTTFKSGRIGGFENYEILKENITTVTGKLDIEVTITSIPHHLYNWKNWSFENIKILKENITTVIHKSFSGVDFAFIIILEIGKCLLF